MERLLNLDEWRWDRLQPEQFMLLAIVAGVLIIVAVFWILARRKKKHRPHDLGIDLDRYRRTNPCFYHVLAAVVEAGRTQDLTRRGDVRAALKLLQEREQKFPAKPKSKSDRRSSLIDRPSPTASREDAATMTIVRAVYMDQSLSSLLSAEAVGEVDRYLDSLTG